MNARRQYIVLAVVLLLETFFLSILCSTALNLPVLGSIGYLLAVGVVFFYSVRHGPSFAIIADLYNVLLLGYFAQTTELAMLLIFFIISGASPSVEQLAPSLARLAFAAMYAATVLCAGLLSRGNVLPGLGSFICYSACALAIGFLGSRFLIRPSVLEEAQHE